jgi:hypothetical protein
MTANGLLQHLMKSASPKNFRNLCNVSDDKVTR